MTANSAEAGSARRRQRRRLSLTLVVCIAAALFAADSYLKTSPHLGYHPAEATWVAYTNELGGFWRGLETTDLDARLVGEGHYPLRQWKLSTRASMGIRPTPTRWSVWFGRPLVVSGGEGGVGICLRPGLLLRAADLVGRAFGAVSESNGISRYGEWMYAWRDGYLLAAHSATIVETLIESSAIVEHGALPESGTAGFRWRAGREGELVLSPEDGLPVQGWIAAASTVSDGAHPANHLGNPSSGCLGLAARLSDAPLLTLTGTASDELAGLLRYALERMPASDLFYPILEETIDILPEGWAAAGNPFEFALTGVDTTETVAIPEMAYVALGRTPEYTGIPPRVALKHEWGALTGWIRPLAGEKLWVCAATHGSLQILTSQEPLMAELAPRFADVDADAVSGQDGNLRMTLYWEECSELFAELLLRAADHELIRRLNREDVEARYLPYVDMCRVLGTLQLEGAFQESRFEFRGYLARPDLVRSSADAAMESER